VLQVRLSTSSSTARPISRQDRFEPRQAVGQTLPVLLGSHQPDNNAQ
jgi:hypothetical protein